MAETLRVGIAGLGTVGAETFRILSERKDILLSRSGKKIEVVAVSSQDRHIDRGIDLSGVEWVDDARKLCLMPNVDVVVELIGGAEGIAKDIAEATVTNSKYFVTANKALIAHYGDELGKNAEKNDVSIGFEAAVAGGIPIIKTLREGLGGNQFTRVYGILNGTCNYILSEMRETGRDFKDVLTDAQALGYAEADPSFDIDGIDAAHKLSILASIVFQTKINFEAIYTEGIRFISPIDLEFATELGFRIKLLGIAEIKDEVIQQRVRPCLVSINSQISQVEGVFNAVAVEGGDSGLSLSYGRGAGGGPTASSVISDLLDIASNRRVPNFGVKSDDLVARKSINMDGLHGSYYLRLKVFDRPGVLADLTAIFRDENVSVEAILQRGRDPEELVPVVLTTHETNEEAILRSISKFKLLDSVAEDPRILPIEKFS
ncbi:MAG: homoserine dehydrogenase [Alphaproteobacteria bacterium]|nr:homoserine dehydrogenase [Alphaproteobacteria bacterium]